MWQEKCQFPATLDWKFWENTLQYPCSNICRSMCRPRSLQFLFRHLKSNPSLVLAADYRFKAFCQRWDESLTSQKRCLEVNKCHNEVAVLITSGCKEQWKSLCYFERRAFINSTCYVIKNVLAHMSCLIFCAQPSLRALLLVSSCVRLGFECQYNFSVALQSRLARHFGSSLLNPNHSTITVKIPISINSPP